MFTTLTAETKVKKISYTKQKVQKVPANIFRHFSDAIGVEL